MVKKLLKKTVLVISTKLYLTLHGADSLHSENTTMGQKAGSICKMRNKEQGRETWEIALAEIHKVTLVWDEEAQSWVGI